MKVEKDAAEWTRPKFFCSKCPAVFFSKEDLDKHLNAPFDACHLITPFFRKQQPHKENAKPTPIPKKKTGLNEFM